MRMKEIKTLVLGLVFALSFSTITNARTENAGQRNGYIKKGEVLFLKYCAVCHGTDAKGGGPASDSLKVPAPDLTIIQKPGERFPENHVAIVIDGEKAVTAHGTRQMPVWGTILRKTSGDLQKHADIYSLVRYIESLQVAGK